MPESLPSGVATFTRRTTIGALPLIALAGCRWGPEDEESPAVEQAQDADAGLVTTATQAIADVAVTLRVTAEEHIGLSGALAPLSAVHAAHLQLLSPGTNPVGASTTRLGQSSRAALAEVTREEARLQTQLADLASSAVSGTLARAFASMSASIAQHLTALPDVAKGPA